MNFLIFGLERPKLSFKQDPEKGTVIQCDNKYRLEHYAPDEPVTWRDIAWALGLDTTLMPIPINEERDPKEFEREWHTVAEKLKTLCQTDVERVFLDKIAKRQADWELSRFNEEENFKKGDAQTRERFFRNLLDKPALIPQVWVNWIHYDYRDKERAERSHLEPFRVDFLYQGESDNGVFKRVVVEIDDIGHIADIEKDVGDFLRSPEAKPSLGKFTEHLRKDRWLRHHGWEVCRFSTLEVEKENSGYLYFEMLGEPETYRISPSYFPHKE